MITINDIPAAEIDMSAIRASGPGGQNVNKLSSAIHLRFDVRASSLPDAIKSKLLAISDARLTSDGVIVIKAQIFRSQEKNRTEALQRLDDLLQEVQRVRKVRKATRPGKGAVRKRLDNKRKQGQRKKLRGRIDY
jgi:ribosome-associated protein